MLKRLWTDPVRRWAPLSPHILPGGVQWEDGLVTIRLKIKLQAMSKIQIIPIGLATSEINVPRKNIDSLVREPNQRKGIISSAGECGIRNMMGEYIMDKGLK